MLPLQRGHPCSYAIITGQVQKLTPVPSEYLGLRTGVLILCRRHGLCAQHLHDDKQRLPCGFGSDGLLRFDCSIRSCVGDLRVISEESEGILSNVFATFSS